MVYVKMESRVFGVFFLGGGVYFYPLLKIQGNITALDHQMKICCDLLLTTSMTCILGVSVFFGSKGRRENRIKSLSVREEIHITQ